jgi:excisionase family DNA binding protein
MKTTFSSPEPAATKVEQLLLTSTEAADALRISPRKLSDLERVGRIRAVRIGRSVRFSLEDLRDFARRQG